MLEMAINNVEVGSEKLRVSTVSVHLCFSFKEVEGQREPLP